jgi:hypothetical protein
MTHCAGFNETSVAVILLRLPMVMRITGLAAVRDRDQAFFARACER